MNKRNYKPLLIVGHKRSGSTHLGRILNMHPQIYIGREIDILWILSQYSKGKKIKPYLYDGPLGLEITLNSFGHLLSKNKTPGELFQAILLEVMRKGTPLIQSHNKSDLIYLGDQKPFQNIDPIVVDFTMQHLKSPTYIHLIRHPKDVISSCMRFGPEKDGGWMWKGLSEVDLLWRWVQVEKWVDKERHLNRHLIIDLKYEDLVAYPIREMARVFTSLGLKYDNTILNKIASSIKSKKRTNHLKIDYTPEALGIMQKYGYGQH